MDLNETRQLNDQAVNKGIVIAGVDNVIREVIADKSKTNPETENGQEEVAHEVIFVEPIRESENHETTDFCESRESSDGILHIALPEELREAASVNVPAGNNQADNHA
jgi:hypothetical protein